MATYGLTPAGFVLKPQSQIVAEIQAALQLAFGANINLGPESVFGQLVGIFSEREALLWELGLAVYSSQYPSGAEGTSVDNILALNNLKRLGATATKTIPEPVVQPTGISLYGLLLFGTPGTVIPAGSIINTTASPPLSFTLDASVTIAAAVNAVQSLFLSNVPTVGAFTLSIIDPAGSTLTTPSIQWNAVANQTLLTIGTTPVGASHFGLTLTRDGVALTTANISTPGAFPSAASIQSAITALTGYSGVTVAGSAGSYTITWGSIANPIVTVVNNTTAATITPVDSVQAAINNLFDSTANNYPYSDVTVASSSGSFVFTFGGGTVTDSNPVSGAQPQALMTVVSNTLMNGSTVTNTNVSTTITGAKAQGIGSATCTTTGPNFVAANTLTVIGSPVSGWASVTNQLDCLTGTNVEDDTQALTRRANELALQANGPIQSIVEKVLAVTGVTQAIAFQNLTNAAQQNINFSAVPVSGNFQYKVAGQTTSSLAFNVTAAQFQTALRLLIGFSNALVTGNVQFGFVIDFNGSNGAQAIDLGSIVSNSTGVTITPSFGRPPHSFEIVVQGGSNVDIANAILGSQPAGIKSYGSTTVQVLDVFNNVQNISFSRPSQIPVYVVISLTTDTYNTPGSPGSGVNPTAKFVPGSVPTIQSDVVNIGNAVPIGGLIIGFGSNGLIGAFNSVPGIVSYTMFFGLAPSPGSNANIQMQAEQAPFFEIFNVVVSWT